MVVALALVGGGIAFARLAPSPGLDDDKLKAFGFTRLPEPKAVESFALSDATGQAFTADRFRDRWSFVFFGYANCPDICPTTMAVLGKAETNLEASGDALFQGVMVTVDPERDLPEYLASYVASFSPNFIGVTGATPELTLFARSLHAGFSRVPVEDSALGYLMDHASHIAVVDPLARHYGFVRPPHDAQQLATLTRELVRGWATQSG